MTVHSRPSWCATLAWLALQLMEPSFAWTQAMTHPQLAEEIAKAMVRGGVDATWSVEVEINKSAQAGLGTSGRKGQVRVVTAGSGMWVRSQWEESGKLQSALFDAVTLGRGRPVFTRTKVGSEQSVEISHDFGLTGISDDLPLLTQSFRGLLGLIYPDLAQALTADESLSIVGSDPITITADAPSTAAEFDNKLVLIKHPLRLAEIQSMRRVPLRAIDGDPVSNGGAATTSGWRTIGSAHVPELIVRKNYAWFPQVLEQDMQRTTYRLLAATESNEMSTKFPDPGEWLVGGTGVMNDRLGISAVIGSDVISMYASQYLLRRPLTADDVLSGGALASLCVGAERVKSESPAVTDISTAPSRISGALVAAMLCVVGGGALWFWRCRTTVVSHRSRVCCLLLMLGGSGYLVWDAASRVSQSGPVFDLGQVLVTDGPRTALGSIELTGASDRILDVVTLVPSCGCLSVDVTARSIPAGGKLSLGARLDVASVGERRAFVTAIFGDGSRQVIHVRATGIHDASKGVSLRLSTSVVDLARAKEQTVTAIWMGNSTRVPLPRWRPPTGVRIVDEHLRFLPTRSDPEVGTWEFTASFVVESQRVPGGIWTTLFELNGAQAGSLFILGGDGPT